MDGDISVKSNVGFGSEFIFIMLVYIIDNICWFNDMSEVKFIEILLFSKFDVLENLKGCVLFVEDYLDNWCLIVWILECMGLIVIIVENGKDVV